MTGITGQTLCNTSCCSLEIILRDDQLMCKYVNVQIIGMGFNKKNTAPNPQFIFTFAYPLICISTYLHIHLFAHLHIRTFAYLSARCPIPHPDLLLTGIFLFKLHYFLRLCFFFFLIRLRFFITGNFIICPIFTNSNGRHIIRFI
jgi:hypothetical protein